MNTTTRWIVLAAGCMASLLPACEQPVKDVPAMAQRPMTLEERAQQDDEAREAACPGHAFSGWQWGCHDIARDTNRFGDAYGPYKIYQKRVCVKCGKREDRIEEMENDPMPGPCE